MDKWDSWEFHFYSIQALKLLGFTCIFARGASDVGKM